MKLYLEDTIAKVLQVMLPLQKHYRVPDGKDKISHSCENTDTLTTPDVHATQTSDSKLKIFKS